MGFRIQMSAGLLRVSNALQIQRREADCGIAGHADVVWPSLCPMLGICWVAVGLFYGDPHHCGVGSSGTHLSILRYVAAHHQYWHDDCDVSDGLLIQNTQNRDAKAINLKLNELIHAISNARNQMIDIGNLTDAELDTLAARYQAIRDRAGRTDSEPIRVEAITVESATQPSEDMRAAS
jgi:hypothetical protein